MSDEQPGATGHRPDPTDGPPQAPPPYRPPAPAPAAPVAPPPPPVPPPPYDPEPTRTNWQGIGHDEPTTAMPLGGQPQWGQPQPGPPQWGQPQQGPPQWGTTPGGPGWGQTPPPSQPPPSTGRGRLPLILGLVVVAVLVVGGIIAAATVLGGSAIDDLTLSIDGCEIAADGSMTATGTIDNSGGDRALVEVEVAFSDSDSGGHIATDAQTLNVASRSSERWSISGTAGDEVRQIVCDVVARP